MMLKMLPLTKRLIEDNKHLVKYDAILVDEGQDFHLEWWNVLKSTVKNEGEMLLAPM